MSANLNNSIAIVGMSCRFPNANSLDDFWEILKNGQDTIAEISKERWNAEAIYDPDPLAERKTHQKHASLLSNIHHFDPLFFNISPAEAIEMSPSQKLMLELAWESIEGSNIPFKQIQGKNVGVFVGNIWSDFEHYRKIKNAKATLHSAVGMSSNVVANRVSFALGFTGPSLVIDTGCSASLVALHVACQSLITQESEMAVVGGINHILDPSKYIELTRFGGLSMKGKCSTFDIDADGFVRGEGGGVLLLKRLSDAERDGNKILAVIRGTSVNNNGYNDTLPATSTQGQKSLFESAYKSAGVQPHEVHYVEAHGTGTKLGDPNEARAIGEFFRTGRNGMSLRVGSVKTNIGHTEATAGIAGLIKVVLAMQHEVLPPNLNFNSPNPDINFQDLKLEVQKELTTWPAHAGDTFKAGINSFGWGGTNAHAVLEQYPIKRKQHPEGNTPAKLFCLPLSAKSSQALQDYAKAYVQLLEKADEEAFQNICIATALCKAEFDHRYLFAGNNRLEVLEQLNDFIQEEAEVTPIKQVSNHDKLVFVFPGQGAQWLGMGRDLLIKEKVFREAIEACDEAFKPYTDWSLIDQLNATPETSRLNEINVIQPALFAMQIAFAKLWMSWGLKPQAVVGHSMGEVAAAHIAGALSLHDAACIICTRSRLMKTVSGTGGAMVVTELSQNEALKVVEGYPNKLSVAVNNSPKSTVLAGDKASIEEVMKQLESKGLFCRLVKVDVASHSPQMDPLKEPLHAAIQNVKPQPSTIPFVSTVFNEAIEGTALNADYWVNNLRGTVQFASVIKSLLEDQHTIFLEANPHPVLINALNECAEANRSKIITVASTAREKAEQKEMLKNLSDLYSKGYPFDWNLYYNITTVPEVNLPLYPFQREAYEIEDLSKELTSSEETPALYPLLGNKIQLAHSDNTFFWESMISLSKFPYLKDHHVNNKIELPIACYIEIILEAVGEIFKGNVPVSVENIHLSKQLFLSEEDRMTIQVKVTLHENNKGEVYVFKRENGEEKWCTLAFGNINAVTSESNIQKAFENIEYREPSYTQGIHYYNLLRSIGFEYGKHFHQLTGLDKISGQNCNKILFSIKPDNAVSITAGKYKIHPALIHTFFQPLLGQLTSILEEGNYLHVEFNKIHQVQVEGEVNYNRELRGLMIIHKRDKHEATDTWSFHADIVIANYDNTPIMCLQGVEGVAKRILPVLANSGHANANNIPSISFKEMKSDTDKIEVLQDVIKHHASKIIKISANRIKNTMTFKGMGVDSLMAVQLRNLLEKDFQVKLPVGMFWSHPSIQDYALYLKDVLEQHIYGTNHATSQQNKKVKTKNWFSIPKPNPDAAVKIFCFHDAGGSASLFDGWENLLDSSTIEFIAVELPGRGRRLEEIPYTETPSLISDLMPAIEPLLDKPYLFLGHSMGGQVAFEVIRELRRKEGRLPESLFISSTSGLDAYDKKQVDYTLSNDELVYLYPHLDLKVIGDVELQNMLINILRADLQLLYNHQYTIEAPLAIPIIAIHGDEDERVKRSQIEQWEKETNISFKLISRTGGHRYIEHDREFVTALIMEEVYQKVLVTEKIYRSNN